MTTLTDRRRLIVTAGASILGLTSLPLFSEARKDEQHEDAAAEVPAAEDLMREHGVLRRALLVYAEAASRLSSGQRHIPLESLGQAAALFRTFGEDYHERSLEEKHVFPPLLKAGGANGSIARVLTRQHERGRQITDYISGVARIGDIPSTQVEVLARTLTQFVRMYEHHAAIEDTVIFPAWKSAISPAQYRELTEQFEDLEHKMFGEDGYEDAVKRIAAIEAAFDLSDLDKLTAPPPPRIA